MFPLLMAAEKRPCRALEAINFTLPVGRSVGLVGRIGSGKSTVAQLVPRLFDVTAGEILLDGQDIRKLSLYVNCAKLSVTFPRTRFCFQPRSRRNLDLRPQGECPTRELDAGRERSPNWIEIWRFFPRA